MLELQYHTPRNLILALMGEVGELAEVGPNDNTLIVLNVALWQSLTA